mmetsp:Transcript_13611/g.27501  ORF Transcript_13611/g.27501 Transcript_13611/m.27501 type:complete len:320 (-) Transcript_13611:79-1038(-)
MGQLFSWLLTGFGGGQTEEVYRPLRKHPALFEPHIPEEWLAPELVKVVQAFRDAPEPGPRGADALGLAPPGTLREEVWEVYSFPCFSNLFMKMFKEEIRNFYKSGIPARRPNSMNNYGVIVNEIGMRPMITAFQQQYIWPLARRLFPEEGERFDDHHSFIVRYQASEDLGLDMHTDDSDVTFNVCLGDEFTGATLTFCGQIGTPAHRQLTHTYSHELGRAVIHLGSRRHGADDIASGRRLNLIVWSHNARWRLDHPSRRKDPTYHEEQGPPDQQCLSYTHDRDYRAYKRLPLAAQKRQLRPWCPPLGKEYTGWANLKEL